MGKQIYIAATATDLRGVISTLMESGYSLWSKLQRECYRDIEKCLSDFDKQHVLYVTTNESRIVYTSAIRIYERLNRKVNEKREDAGDLPISGLASDAVELSCGCQGIASHDNEAFFYCGRVYMNSRRNGTVSEKQPQFMLNLYNSVCRTVRGNAIGKLKQLNRTYWLYPQAREIISSIGMDRYF